ncbi:MAG: outer membrane beta-barrel protein [Acidobacteriaceae bacterium]|nr:outer membrane beta-barrel protein [Acidobacteriaceae bacterium]
MLKKLFLISLLLGSGAAYAQIAPSVEGGNSSLWVGGEFGSFNSDYLTRSRIIGPGVNVDYNFNRYFGALGEARWLHWNGTDSQTQSDYLAGGKGSYPYHRFTFTAKFLFGGVWVKFPVKATGGATGSYFAYAIGGNVDYRVARRWSVRGGYEYQILPSAPGLHNGPSNGMTPSGFTAGVNYRILGVR